MVGPLYNLTVLPVAHCEGQPSQTMSSPTAKHRLLLHSEAKCLMRTFSSVDQMWTLFLPGVINDWTTADSIEGGARAIILQASSTYDQGGSGINNTTSLSFVMKNQVAKRLHLFASST